MPPSTEATDAGTPDPRHDTGALRSVPASPDSLQWVTCAEGRRAHAAAGGALLAFAGLSRGEAAALRLAHRHGSRRLALLPLHDPRRVYASVLIASGGNVDTVLRGLGHTSATTTVWEAAAPVHAAEALAEHLP